MEAVNGRLRTETEDRGREWSREREIEDGDGSLDFPILLISKELLSKYL
jgi:hypothetical protein